MLKTEASSAKGKASLCVKVSILTSSKSNLASLGGASSLVPGTLEEIQ